MEHRDRIILPVSMILQHTSIRLCIWKMYMRQSLQIFHYSKTISTRFCKKKQAVPSTACLHFYVIFLCSDGNLQARYSIPVRTICTSLNTKRLPFCRPSIAPESSPSLRVDSHSGRCRHSSLPLPLLHTDPADHPGKRQSQHRWKRTRPL